MPTTATSRFTAAKVRFLIAGLLSFTGAIIGAYALTGVSKPGLTSHPRPQRYMPVAGERGEDLDRLEMDWHNRLTYPTGIFNPAWLRSAALQDRNILRQIPLGLQTFAQANSLISGLTLSGNSFTALGPTPLQMTGCSGCYDYTKTEGRVNAIVVDPTTTTNGSIVAYFGSDGGGVWKTMNCCNASTTWTSTTNDPLISTISIDTLTIDPHNHNTVYAGTGDLNYGSFSMGSHGILKSTDAGNTWTVLGPDVFGAALPEPSGRFPQYQAVGKVRVDPRNANTVVAGTKTGLFFSYDAGNHWTGPCTTNSYTGLRQDITGLELINAGTSTRIIAAVGVRGYATPVQFNLNQNGANGIYAGTVPAIGCPGDFQPIATNSNGWKIGSANMNPASGHNFADTTSPDQLGRIDIAVAPSNPSYIYAQVQAIAPQSSCGSAPGCELGAWRTTDGGANWTLIPGSTGAELKDCGGSGADYNQNWYDQGVAVDPNDPNHAFFDTFDIWSWHNGDASWRDTTCGYSGSTEVVHVDQHALAFLPGSSKILLAGSDGGVYSTINADNPAGLPTWVNMDNGVNTIEFYSGDISASFATSAKQQAVGGAQDNGASSVTFPSPLTGPVQWQMGVGGDGFYARIDPVGGRFWQGNNGGQLNYCDNTAGDCTNGATANWVPDSSPWTAQPDRQSFVLPFEIYKGTPGDPVNDCPPSGCGHLIAGTYRVWETLTNGNAWVPVSGDLTKQTLADRSYINQLAFEPKDQARAMVGTNDGNVQYGHGAAGGGISTWVDITGGNNPLPNRPILDVAFDPTTTTSPIGYAAVGGFNPNTPDTPGHVFQVTCTADCATFTWKDKTGNLPDIPVDSIIANPNVPLQVFAGTDWGLYFTNDISATSPVWYRFENGLPHAMIWDLQIDRGATTLSVWTRSRGAYVWPLPSGPIPTPNLIITSIAHSDTNNHATLHAKGVPGAVHRVEASPNLSANSWTTIGSPTADGSGKIIFEDSNPQNLAVRFYRLAYP